MTNNFSGHTVFKLTNKEAVSVNRMTKILMSQALNDIIMYC